MKLILLPVVFFLGLSVSLAQTVAINTSGNTGDASSILDVSSSSKGVLVPRMSTAQINAIASPAKGLLVYDSILNQFKVNLGNATTPNWQSLAGLTNVWALSGNSGTNSGNNFIGTTDNTPLNFRVNNQVAGRVDSVLRNTFWGYSAGGPSGATNTAIGFFALSANTNGNGNVAVGSYSLLSNTTGYQNTSVGNGALFSNTNGVGNTAVGAQALTSNIDGINNVALGTGALEQNSHGVDNTSGGYSALAFNTTGSENTAFGNYALLNNQTAINNTAIGSAALKLNQTGTNNTATGFSSLLNNSASYNTGLGAYTLNFNTSGNSNCSVGFKSLYQNTTGDNNTANGNSALYSTTTGDNNTAFGLNALFSNTTGSNNTAIGVYADVSAGNLTNATAIGYNTYVNASNKIRLGNTAVTVIEGQVPFTNPSDARFKYNIKQNVPGLAFIKKLTPVTYYFDEEKLDAYSRTGVLDNNPVHTAAYAGEKPLHTGFLAQDVEKAARELGYSFDGLHAPANEKDHYSLAYSQFIMPLVKAVQEQQEIIDQQNQKIDQQNQKIDQQENEMQELKAQLKGIIEKPKHISQKKPTVNH